MNSVLFKQNIKKCYKIYFLIIAISIIYNGFIMNMFNPSLSGIIDIFKQKSPDFIQELQFDTSIITLEGFINKYINNFSMIILPFVFTFFVIYKTIVNDIHCGYISLIITSANSRKKIILTHVFSCIFFLFAFVFLNCIVTIIMSDFMYKGILDIRIYIIMAVTIFFIQLEICAVMFFVACYCEDIKGYVLIGGGVPLLFFIIYLISNLNTKVTVLKYLTVFSLFNGERISAGIVPVFSWLVLLITSGILFIIGILHYKNREFKN